MKIKVGIILVSVCWCFLLSGSAKAETSVGYGWSVDGSESEAVDSALAAMRAEVKNPEFVLLYSTVGYNTSEVVRHLKKRVGNNTAIFGMTSIWGVITRDGIHVGKKGSLAMLGISSSDIEFRVTGDVVEPGDDVISLSAVSIKKAMNQASGIGKNPDIILMSASPGIEEDVLSGVAAVLGRDIPVYGGSAADNTISGQWKLINDSSIYSSGFVFTLIYTSLKVGHAYHSGYLGSDKSGMATRVKNEESRILLEIDGEPAAEIYNGWAYNQFNKAVKEGGNILGPSSFFPLAIKITTDQRDHFIGIHPSEIGENDKSLSLFANVKEGSKLYFTEGTENALIYRPKTITRRALIDGRIKKESARVGFFIYCGGTMLAVQKRIDEIVPIINKSIGDVPYIGAFTFGEQGNIRKFGNFHGNLMSSMVILGEQ